MINEKNLTELLQKILHKSNTDYCQSSEDMQDALEQINELIRQSYPDLGGEDE